jgi:hypothetical protein
MAPFDKEWIGWAMFSTKGKLVTALNTQAADIQQLYSELLDYDKKLIPFSPAR